MHKDYRRMRYTISKENGNYPNAFFGLIHNEGGPQVETEQI